MLCLELFFVVEMEQKQEIWSLKCKSLNINLFIKLLDKINQICNHAYFWRKWHFSCDINYMKWYKYRLYIYFPHIFNDVIILNVF